MKSMSRYGYAIGTVCYWRHGRGRCGYYRRHGSCDPSESYHRRAMTRRCQCHDGNRCDGRPYHFERSNIRWRPNGSSDRGRYRVSSLWYGSPCRETKSQWNWSRRWPCDRDQYRSGGNIHLHGGKWQSHIHPRSPSPSPNPSPKPSPCC